MHLERAPTVNVEMLIRCPAEQAFTAFVQPEVLAKFWLSRASAALEPGREVRWDFLVEGASAQLRVEAMVQNERIAIAFDDGTRVEWTFEQRPVGTLVSIVQSGFVGSGDEVVAKALDGTSGFTLVLSELKLLLEQGKVAGLVKDKALLLS